MTTPRALTALDGFASSLSRMMTPVRRPLVASPSNNNDLNITPDVD